jgi:hypothetical protein
MITSEIDVLADMDALLADPNFAAKMAEREEIKAKNTISYGEEGSENEEDAYVDLTVLSEDEEIPA